MKQRNTTRSKKIQRTKRLAAYGSLTFRTATIAVTILYIAVDAAEFVVKVRA